MNTQHRLPVFVMSAVMSFALGLVTVDTALTPTLSAATQDAQGRVRKPPDSGSQQDQKKGDQPRAVPRAEPKPAPKGEGSPGEHAQPRSRPEQPPRRADVPNRYFRGPHTYAFPPVDLRVGFYYHPYFGFYYGPYYGPFYPYPGPFPRLTRYGTSSVRLRVRPAEAEVYLNGYYAGIVDDFDGVFQRLYVPAGPHRLDLRLDGYESYHQDVYVQPGDTLEVRYEMRRIAPGAVAAPPPRPQPLPSEWTTTESPDAGEAPATPYGVLAIRTDPTDAQILIDGEAWATVAGQREFTIHLAAGWHTLEVRKDSFRPFSTSVEMSEGRTTRLSVELKP